MCSFTESDECTGDNILGCKFGCSSAWQLTTWLPEAWSPAVAHASSGDLRLLSLPPYESSLSQDPYFRYVQARRINPS